MDPAFPFGTLTTADLSVFQAAFQDNVPVYFGDFSRNNAVDLADLSLFQSHFIACGSSDAHPATPQDIVGAVDHPFLYVHVVSRLAQGAPIPIVYPEDAVNYVPATGPGGRDVTVLLFVVRYGALRGVHVHCEWPEGWTLEDVDDTLLDGQLLGYPDPGVIAGSYATAFDCVLGGDPTPVGRFDMHAKGPGAVSLRESLPPRILDCEFREWELGADGAASLARGVLGERGLRLVRSSPSTTAGPAEFHLLGHSGALVSGMVYDVTGRVIKELSIGTFGMDRVLSWDGSTDRGDRAPTGMYYVLVRAGSARFVERTLLIRASSGFRVADFIG